MPYELAADPYIDPASGVLKNKPGITDELELARSEEHSAVIAAVAIADACRPEKQGLTWFNKQTLQATTS